MRVLTDYPYVPSEVLDIIVHHAGEGRTPQLIRELDSAGFQIVPKPDPRERVVRTTTTVEDGHTVIRVKMPEPRLGTVALLTPEGERLVRAVETGNYVGVSERDFTAVVGLRLRLHGPDLRDLTAAFVGKVDSTPGKPVEIKLGERSQAWWAARSEAEKPCDVSAGRPITPEDFTGEAEPAKADVRKKLAEALREKVAEAIPGVPVFASTRRPLTEEDLPTFTVQPGKAEEGQESAADLARRVDPAWCYRNDPAYRARHDQAVRDCLEASRLTYAAAQVIGHEAVSEIFNSASPPPATDTEEASDA